MGRNRLCYPGPRGVPAIVTDGRYRYELVLGMPHTNHRGFAEHLALAHFGHLYWTSIARAIGCPLSTLRSTAGEEVYATFLLHRGDVPRRRPARHLPAGRPAGHRGAPARLQGDRRRGRDHVRRRSPAAGNSALRIAVPANGDFSAIPPLPPADNPYHLTKLAEESGELGLLGTEWEPALGDPVEERQAIDPDRDSNGAGLVYFANYVVFMNQAERVAMRRAGLPEADVLSRAVRARRIAYYGNAGVSGYLRTRVTPFRSSRRPRDLGFRYTIRRDEDDALISLSEAIKVLR